MTYNEDPPPLWQEFVVFFTLVAIFFVSLHLSVKGYEWLMR